MQINQEQLKQIKSLLKDESPEKQKGVIDLIAPYSGNEEFCKMLSDKETIKSLVRIVHKQVIDSFDFNLKDQYLKHIDFIDKHIIIP